MSLHNLNKYFLLIRQRKKLTIGMLLVLVSAFVIIPIFFLSTNSNGPTRTASSSTLKFPSIGGPISSSEAEEASTTFKTNESVVIYGYGPFQIIVKEIDVVSGTALQYQLPVNLETVTNYKMLTEKFHLSNDALNILSKQGFVVIKRSGTFDFADAYFSLPKGFPRIVTTDMMLHVYHALFASILMYNEQNYFAPWLNSSLKAMLNESIRMYETWKQNVSDYVREALAKNIAYFSVLTKLLDPNFTLPEEIPPALVEIINQEISLVENHSLYTGSPLFGHTEDYTQYKPRGYYTINQILRNYFKAVMYMGRMYFEISNADPFTQIEENTTRPLVQTLQALIISDMMNKVYVHTDDGARTFFNIWSRIYNVTSYFVGLSDDLTPIDYKKVTLAVFGEIKNVTTFDNITKVAEVIETLKALPPPKISAIGNKNKTAETGMRLMGQRFILDSYIFQMLVHDSVYERYMPTGLDILNVFGYSRAESRLSTESEEYKKQLEKLRTEIKQMNTTEWTKNLYNGWLYVLQALLKESYNGYPTFMQTDAWKDEKMNTFLGSWTELRHDTILYAKQSYSIGAIAGPPPLSFTEEYRCVGYVEPMPLLWSRLTGLINLTLHGLQLLDVLPYTYWQKLTEMHSLTEFLLHVTLKELRGEPLSDAENLAIYDMGVNITRILQDVPERNRETGIVADVHTDPNSPSVSPTGNKVLEEGVGHIFYLIAIFVREDNKLEFAAGPVFSYYEFLQPMSDRLTDEQWREMLNSMPPPLPDWTTSFIP